MTLPDSAKIAFTKRVEYIEESPYENYEAVIPKVGDILRQTFPYEVQEKLHNMALWGSPSVLYLKNCPVTENPPKTPKEDAYDPAKKPLEEYVELALLDALGADYFPDRQAKGGQGFAQVIACKKGELSSRGFDKLLGPHTDGIQWERPINWIILCCVRGDPNAFTGFISVDHLLEGLPQWVIQEMLRSQFEMRPGPTWKDKKPPTIHPILKLNPSGEYDIRFHSDANRLVAITRTAQLALDYLSEHLKNVHSEKISLKKGEAVIWQNQRVLHERTSFIPSNPEGEERWLVRAYGVPNFMAIRKLLQFYGYLGSPEKNLLKIPKEAPPFTIMSNLGMREKKENPYAPQAAATAQDSPKSERNAAVWSAQSGVLQHGGDGSRGLSLDASGPTGRSSGHS